MKNAGIVRRIDSLGRIVIPKEIRKNLDLNKFEALEMFFEDDKIILKKFSNFLSPEKLKLLCNTISQNSSFPCAVFNKKSMLAKSKLSFEILPENFLNTTKKFFDLTKPQICSGSALGLPNFSQIIVAPIIIDLNCEYILLSFLDSEAQSQNAINIISTALSILTENNS